MNKERILQLADIVERQKHDPESGEGFNMALVLWPCGTPACICGWALHEFNPAALNSMGCYSTDYLFEQGAKTLEITESQANDLFCPDKGVWRYIEPQHAAETLRHFAETGEIVW